ncbi:fibronectin type III domain-containing protein [Chryseobacterium pennipullorum]|uniref:Fibronectin type-III domain-containing protein n=1 Tax=Chryseobacterium pennipullorum TaxID=2258963 RepID=A0A3D9B1C2_9FLAO|nr:fibronectin type III domain-containing protein [Chryseobacterium pennipullorum]REC47002.1 hypothetical protein DRF67_12340 [Chryseobacterium pennipullorum]
MSGLLLCKMGRPFRVLITLLCIVFGLFVQAQIVTIGTGTTGQRYPLGSYYGFERSASLYTAAEITAGGGGAGSILSVGWNAKSTMNANIPVKIYIKTVPSTTTTLTSQTWGDITTGATYVFSGNMPSIVVGWNTFQLQVPFTYNGTDNLVVMVETNFGSYGGGTGSSAPNITYTSSTSKHMYIQTDSSPPTTTTGTVNANRPNIQLTLGTAPACIGMQPGGTLSMGTITPATAVLNWTPYTSAPAGYDVYYSTTNTPPTAATVPSQTVTGTTATLSPLTPDTTYYAWVRARCSATEQSQWTGPISFLTPPTCPPLAATALSVGTLTPANAIVNWTAPTPAPAGGYELYYSTTNTPPTAATTPSQVITTGTTATLSPLVSGTTYYWWVRIVCSGTDKSIWVAGPPFTPGQIGSGSDTVSQLPINSNYGYNYSQQIYTAAEVLGAVGTGKFITEIKFYVSSPGTDQGRYNQWVVYMANTTQNNFGTTSSWVPFNSLKQVWSGTLPTMTAGTWVTIPLTSPLLWDGTSNIVVAVDENTPDYTSQAEWGGYTAGTNRGILYQSDSTNPDPVSPPNGNYRFEKIPQLRLTGVELQPCSTAPPSNIAINNITASSAIVSWTPTNGATYQLRYRKIGDPWGATINITTPLTSSYNLYNLTDSTQYEVQIATICGGTGAFSPSVNFTTPALTYCDNTPSNTTSDGYISKVVVTPTGAPLMVSESGYDVYKDYSADATRLITLVRGKAGNKISVTKYWPGSTSSYGVAVWIDYNRNGVFEASEQILTSTSNTTTPVSNNNFTVALPPDPAIYTGPLVTRMRVAMQQYDTPTACGSFGTFDYGEVEDYAVRLIDEPPCSTTPITNITVSNLTATSATFSWVAATNATYQVRYRQVGTGTWTTINPVPAPGNVYTTNPATPLTEQTKYEVQVSTICSGTPGAFSTSTQFTTPPLSYCPMTGSGNNDHISNVTVTSSNAGVPVMSNTSVQTNYFSYTTPETLITLDLNSQNNKISVAKGWNASTSNDAVSVWIDFDRNGTFDTNERIFNSPASTTTPVETTFAVPGTAYTGALGTTMRVVLKRTSAPVMCQNAVNGEVEDYKVMIRPCSNLTPNAPTFTRTHNSATISWTGVTNNVSYVVRYRVQGTTAWTQVYASTLLGNIPLTINGLTPATTYEVEIAAICGENVGTPTAIKTFVTRCDPTAPNVTISNITPTTALITWSPLAASSTYTMRWRKVGTTGWPNPDIALPAAPANTYVLGSVTPLEPYTTYEVQIANQCVGETTINPYSNPKVFTTERICEIPPPGLTITQLLPTSAEIKWDAFPGATYVLRYRKVGIPSWTEVQTPINNVVLTGLTEMTKYEMQVVNICNGTPGNYTPPYYFTTPTVIYCKMASESSTGEHISKVTVKPNGKPTMTNESGASTYTDYTGVPKTFIEMIQGSTDNEITIEKKWTGNTYNEGIAVWIDFNRNGEFDINEKVFTSPPNTNSPVSGTFSVPADAFVSMTDYKYVVMRVAMSRDGIPVNCTNMKNGEVEDYTVRISKKGVTNPIDQTEIMIYPNPVTTILHVKNISKKAKYKIYNAAGQVIADGILLNNQINVSRLINGVYVIDIDDNGTTAQKKFIKE